MKTDWQRQLLASYGYLELMGCDYSLRKLLNTGAARRIGQSLPSDNKGVLSVQSAATATIAPIARIKAEVFAVSSAVLAVWAVFDQTLHSAS